MAQTIGLAGCSTIARELRECCRQLGLPVRMYAARPVCLFGAEDARLAALIDRARRETKQLLVALGRCCGAASELDKPGAVSAARCTELLSGSGTYEWLTEHGALPLPPPYFSIWLNSPPARQAVGQVLKSAISAGAIQSIAALENPQRGCDPYGLAELQEMSGICPRRLFVGLGHMREALRAAAEAIGLSPGIHKPAPIPYTTLGPGDDCLALSTDPAHSRRSAAELLAANLQRGLRCVWVTAGGAHDDVESLFPDAPAAKERGDLKFVDAQAIFAETGGDDPQIPVTYWVNEAKQALADGRCGLCIVHGDGWADEAQLPSEYTLAYTARLSAACAKWPISNLLFYTPSSDADSLMEELACTHPLVWDDNYVRVSRLFERAEQYLGEEDLLESLGRERVSFTCAQVQPLVSALADGEVDGPSAVALAHHAQECPSCRQALQAHRELKQALAPLRRSVEGVADELWARISREIDEMS